MEWNVCLNFKIWKYFKLNKFKYAQFFQPLEVMGRSSETQLHVGENLNKLTSDKQDKA